MLESQNSASRKVIFNDRKKYNLLNNGTYNCTLQFEMKKVPDKYVEIIIYTPMWQLCAPMMSWVVYRFSATRYMKVKRSGITEKDLAIFCK